MKVILYKETAALSYKVIESDDSDRMIVCIKSNDIINGMYPELTLKKEKKDNKSYTIYMKATDHNVYLPASGLMMLLINYKLINMIRSTFKVKDYIVIEYYNKTMRIMLDDLLNNFNIYFIKKVIGCSGWGYIEFTSPMFVQQK